MIRERLLLREFVRSALQVLSEEGAGARLDAEERAAKAAYDKAKAELEQWRAEQAKKRAFVNAAKELGLNPEGESARKKLKGDPRYSYDPKVVQKREETLQRALDKAKSEWGAYDPSVTDYQRVGGSEKAAAGGAAQLPEKGTKVYFPIGSVKPLQWYSWDDPRWLRAIKGIAFGSSKEKSGEERAGTGPGEERLGKIFGGRVQGGGVSFDVVTPDERRWEVKALETAGDLIRPGTEGLAAFEKPRRRLEAIMKQMKNFIAMAKRVGMQKSVSPEEWSVVSYVDGFVSDEFDLIVGKGELAAGKFKALRAALRAVSTVKKKWESAGADPDVDTTIGMAGKEISVDKPTYVDVAKRVEKSVPDAGVLGGLEQHELVLATLRDAAFEDPAVFFDEWFESVDVNRVFEQVDGVFIVTPKGFSMVPKGLFKRAFRFKRVTQAKPQFEYVYFDAGSAGAEAE